MMHALVAVLWLLFGVVNAGLAFALFQRRWPRRRVVDFQNDRWIATTTILGGPVALTLTLVLLWCLGYYGWLWPWSHEALEEADLV